MQYKSFILIIIILQIYMPLYAGGVWGPDELIDAVIDRTEELNRSGGVDIDLLKVTDYIDEAENTLFESPTARRILGTESGVRKLPVPGYIYEKYCGCRSSGKYKVKFHTMFVNRDNPGWKSTYLHEYIHSLGPEDIAALGLSNNLEIGAHRGEYSMIVELHNQGIDIAAEKKMHEVRALAKYLNDGLTEEEAMTKLLTQKGYPSNAIGRNGFSYPRLNTPPNSIIPYCDFKEYSADKFKRILKTLRTLGKLIGK